MSIEPASPGLRQCKASLFIEGDTACFLVTETPSEVATLVDGGLIKDKPALVQLTSGNQGVWNGKPIFVRADLVRSITPPMEQND